MRLFQTHPSSCQLSPRHRARRRVSSGGARWLVGWRRRVEGYYVACGRIVSYRTCNVSYRIFPGALPSHANPRPANRNRRHKCREQQAQPLSQSRALRPPSTILLLHAAARASLVRRRPISMASADLRAASEATIADYAAVADAYAQGNLDHDVSQNIEALLKPLKGRPEPLDILDVCCASDQAGLGSQDGRFVTKR